MTNTQPSHWDNLSKAERQLSMMNTQSLTVQEAKFHYVRQNEEEVEKLQKLAKIIETE
jgi:hypothetical protein